jgi:hypothetical protein
MERSFPDKIVMGLYPEESHAEAFFTFQECSFHKLARA